MSRHSPRRRLRAAVPPITLAVLTMLVVGCFAHTLEGTRQSGAIEIFARTYTCDEETIRLEPRLDLNPYDFRPGHPRPTVDVERDPQRLRVWRQTVVDAERESNVYEVIGCGHDVLYACQVSGWGQPNQVTHCGFGGERGADAASPVKH